jgi:hypothetical protein
MSAGRKPAVQTIPGDDLKQVRDEFEQSLAIETAYNSLRCSPITIGHLRSEILALSQGLKALRAVGRALNQAIEPVKP